VLRKLTIGVLGAAALVFSTSAFAQGTAANGHRAHYCLRDGGPNGTSHCNVAAEQIVANELCQLSGYAKAETITPDNFAFATDQQNQTIDIFSCYNPFEQCANRAWFPGTYGAYVTRITCLK
jgi:hypothetical protein